MVNVSNLGFGGSGIPDALPKAVAELQGMRMQIVDGAAAGTVVPVAGMDPEDHIGAALDLTGMATINVGTLSIAERNAKATITCLTTAVEGDKITVNGKTYTVKDVVVHTSYNPPPGVIPIDVTPSGTDNEKLAKALAKALMSGDSTITAAVGPGAGSPPAMNVVTVKVRQPGTAGNAVTLSETGNGFTVSGATFAGGTSAGSGGFTSSASLAGKKILLVWYDKRPGALTNPLMMQVLQGMEEPPEFEELTVTELEPESAVIGEPSFTLHVHGTGFGPDSKIVFNGYEEPTTFVSRNELTTGVDMNVWTAPSEPLPVFVRTGLGDASEPMDFQFNAAEGGALGARGAGGPGGPGGPGGLRGPGGPGGPGGNLTIKRRQGR
jgi:hypothetical protein